MVATTVLPLLLFFADTPGKASTDVSPQVGRSSSKILPLVRISGTTSKTGELLVSPSVLVGIRQYADLQISPIFKASTKEGTTTLNLRQPAGSGSWSVGGGLVVHVLHPNNGNIGDCGKSSDPLCKVLREAVSECDKVLDVKKDEKTGEWACGKKTAAGSGDEKYCTIRNNLGESSSVDSGSLCEKGAGIYGRSKDPRIFQKRYPLAQIYAGALFSRQEFKYVQKADDVLEKTEDPRVTTSMRAGFVSVTEAGNGTFPLTVELALAYRSKLTSSKTPVRWCVDSGNLEIDGASVPAESCTDSVLGPPVLSRTLTGGLFLGGIDIKNEQGRFSAGPEVFFDLATKRRGVALKVPMTIRLTPSSNGEGYLGEYKGVLRITPKIGFDWDPSGAAVGSKVLLTLELLGQQDLFGSALAGL